jgi:hypothetical protein
MRRRTLLRLRGIKMQDVTYCPPGTYIIEKPVTVDELCDLIEAHNKQDPKPKDGGVTTQGGGGGTTNPPEPGTGPTKPKG